MSDLKLYHPVTAVDGQLLLPGGSELSAKTLADLIARARAVSYKKYSLMQYGSVKSDVLYFISIPPYNMLFSDQDVVDDLLSFMENVHLVSPVLESLDYFKEKDMYTYRHVLCVFALCVLISNVMMSDYWERLNEAASGPVHDIGKICWPMHILQKSSPLSMSERSIFEHHTIAGYVLLSYYAQDAGNIFAGIARDHHERRDGSGYPRRIQLSDHLVEVIAVCDVYDALISSRPYRPAAFDNRTALEEITEMGEQHFLNSEVIKALVAVNRHGKTHYSECRVSKERRGNPPQNNNYGFSSDNTQ